MPKRSGQAESGCHDGIRERPATGHGQPRAARHLAIRRLKTCGHFSPSHAAAFIRASFRNRFRSALERCRCSCSEPSVYSVSASSSAATAGS